MATVGGVLGPIGVYLLWTAITGDSTIRNGWGIPPATDIAIAWLVARLVFGNRHPAVSFLLLLAVADDGIGLGLTVAPVALVLGRMMKVKRITGAERSGAAPAHDPAYAPKDEQRHVASV